jgi:2-methylcitrate dehydratase PrpD
MASASPTRTLCEFLAAFRYADVPPEVVSFTKELFVDWVGSALAGKDARPVRALQSFARRMGPAGGPSEVLVDRSGTTPWFAALVNGAASHVVEQDDVHKVP